MKLEPKKTKTMQVRITQDQWRLLNVASRSVGLTPSKLIRMFIDTTCNQLKMQMKKGGDTLEDFETLFND